IFTLDAAFVKFENVRCGHSIVGPAFESNAANSSHSSGAVKITPRAMRIRLLTVLPPVTRRGRTGSRGRSVLSVSAAMTFVAKALTRILSGRAQTRALEART